MEDRITEIQDEIKGYRKQLEDLLANKFVDVALIMGLDNMMQLKMCGRIVADFREYYESIQSGSESHFRTADLIQVIWRELHYPGVKFLQAQHASLYDEFNSRMQKQEQKQGTLRTVEMRKLNESFKKFLAQVSLFYLTLMKHFAEDYASSLFPQTILDHFSFSISEGAKMVENQDVKANHLLLIHRCLSALGDISRHKAFVELFYVKPSISVKNYWKYYNSKRDFENKSHVSFRPLYDKALLYYNFCILLLPALNEPYNQIGMIYNILNDKVDAIYYFLRSSLTRIPGGSLGLLNLNTILLKKSFLDEISIIFRERKRGEAKANSLKPREISDLLFICILGFHYSPKVYQKNATSFTGNIPYTKVEKYFIELSSERRSLDFQESSKKELNRKLKQFLIILSFNRILKNKKSSVHFNEFLFKYVEQVIDYDTFGTRQERSNLLIFLRILFNWLKENPSMLKDFLSRPLILEKTTRLLNILLGIDYDLESDGFGAQQLGEVMKTQMRPKRDYFFVEDIALRDYSVLNHQLRDFNDTLLFETNDINRLDGNFSRTLSSEGLLKQSNNDKSLKNKLHLVKVSIMNREDFLRTHAVILLGYKILKLKGVQYHKDSMQFIEGEKVEKSSISTVSTSKKPSRRKQKQLKVSHEDIKDENREVLTLLSQLRLSETNQVHLPSSLNEINSFILSHSSELNKEVFNSANDDVHAEVHSAKKHQDEPQNASADILNTIIDRRRHEVKQISRDDHISQVRSASPSVISNPPVPNTIHDAFYAQAPVMGAPFQLPRYNAQNVHYQQLVPPAMVAAHGGFDQPSPYPAPPPFPQSFYANSSSHVPNAQSCASGVNYPLNPQQNLQPHCTQEYDHTRHPYGYYPNLSIQSTQQHTTHNAQTPSYPMYFQS